MLVRVGPGLLGRIEADALCTDAITTRARVRALGATDELLRSAVRAGRWRPRHRGVLWVQPLEGRTPARVAAQGARWAVGDGLSPAGVACAATAGALFRWPVAPGVPEVAVLGAHRVARADLRLRQLVLAPGDVTTFQGTPVTTPVRTIVDLTHGASLADALALADAALGGGMLAPAALEDLQRRLPRRLRRAADWAEGRAESVFESRVRAEILLAGLPPPALQHVISDAAGRFAARVDFAWPGFRVVVEADGAATHASPAALREDLRRQNTLVALGWTVLRFTWADLGAIAPVVASALSTARAA